MFENKGLIQSKSRQLYKETESLVNQNKCRRLNY